MGHRSDMESEQVWLEMALRAARNVASSPAELRALRWQAFETSHKGIRQCGKDSSDETQSAGAMKIIQAVPPLFGAVLTEENTCMLDMWGAGCGNMDTWS